MPTLVQLKHLLRVLRTNKEPVKLILYAKITLSLLHVMSEMFLPIIFFTGLCVVPLLRVLEGLWGFVVWMTKLLKQTLILGLLNEINL